MEETHAQVGHLGIEKTLAKVQGLYYWQNMKVDVIIYVRNCLTCQQHKGTTGLQQWWQELPPVEKPLERVSLDLTDMVAGAQEYQYVLTICDHYSRYVKFYQLKTKHTDGVCEEFKSYIMDFGTPKTVLTDNGKEFTVQSFRDLCSEYKITAALTTPYHPQGKTVLRNVCTAP